MDVKRDHDSRLKSGKTVRFQLSFFPSPLGPVEIIIDSSVGMILNSSDINPVHLSVLRDPWIDLKRNNRR